MTKAEKYLENTRHFVAGADRCEKVAAELRSWVSNQAATVRELCPTKRLRCFALVTNRDDRPHKISVEFAAPDDRNYSLLIHGDGTHHLAGRVPHTASLAAATKLLALLTDELGVPVRLQP